MKPNYKNWMPKGMIWSFAAGTAIALVLTLIIGVGWLKIILLILALLLAGITVWTVLMYRAFSYDGKRQMSRQIIDGVAERTAFAQGDALKLEFPDGAFDAVTSNYVYHNIPSRDRQAILLETLRVLKKGGTFAIHYIFSKEKYGDMQSFVKRLNDLGYEQAELIPTDNGRFMSPWEAKWMALSGSALLVGKK